MKKVIQMIAGISLLVGILVGNPVQAQERVVSVGAGITELLEQLEAGKQIIAVDSTSRRFSQQHKLPIVGYQRNLSTEGILSLSPTLVIGSDEMGPKNTLEQLRQAGIKIEVLADPKHNVTDLFQHIQQLGKVLNQTVAADKLYANVTKQVKEIQQLSQKRSNGIFLFLQNKQLYAGGKDTTVAGMLSLLNLTNLAEQKADYYPYSIETLINQQPKVILISERSLAQNITKILETYPFLQQLNAVKNQCIFTVDGQALLGGFNLTSVRETLRIATLLSANPKCY